MFFDDMDTAAPGSQPADGGISGGADDMEGEKDAPKDGEEEMDSGTM